jgi:cyclopropane-fatty-acyl-phospholipid synthase
MRPELQGASMTGPLAPAAEASPGAASVTGIDRWLAATIQRGLDPARVRLVLWDGSTPAGDRAAVGDLLVRDRGTLLALAVYPERWFGEAYAAGRLDVRGALPRVLEAIYSQAGPAQPWRERLAALVTLPNTLRLARLHAHHHYDVGNEFYAAWLGRELVYTCAYFPTPDTPLDAAQTAKLERVCRKLRLQPDDRVLELGCGWGGLALHMARRYGVRVTAFNVATEQIAYARARARREGLDAAVSFVDDSTSSSRSACWSTWAGRSSRPWRTSCAAACGATAAAACSTSSDVTRRSR